ADPVLSFEPPGGLALSFAPILLASEFCGFGCDFGAALSFGPAALLASAPCGFGCGFGAASSFGPAALFASESCCLGCGFEADCCSFAAPGSEPCCGCGLLWPAFSEPPCGCGFAAP